MLPLTAYPQDLPLTSEAALEIYRSSLDLVSGGCFLSFVQIPLEERMGEWRFAGHSDSLQAAMRNVATYCLNMRLVDVDHDGFEELLELTASELATDQDWQSIWDAEFEALEYRLVIAAEGDAPLDDSGFCIVEVESLEAVGFVGRRADTSIPEEWS
jgi:hypothetical protein